ncbi:hypothetical protein MUA01_03335, partial [Enterobacteriaceae bacterium H18W14]|uniref:hypothetical protein n=1 Tax=Dryocola boscaweniae TaxID=2925397 RepID=UPI0022F00A46
YYAFLLQSQAFIFAFVRLTGRFVSRCAVSVEAQYRDFSEADKRLLQINYQASFFSAMWL